MYVYIQYIYVCVYICRPQIQLLSPLFDNSEVVINIHHIQTIGPTTSKSRRLCLLCQFSV